MKKYFYSAIAGLVLGFCLPLVSNGQPQYKLRQVTSMMGMKSETIIYVKPMRKRTESQGMMGIGANQVSIEQCDLKRTVKLNTKKKLYFIEPFVAEDVIDEELEKNKKPTQPVVNKNKPTEKGGTIYMYYNITDTGERKKMFDFTARHIWTTQKIKPSADACSMKDSMIIKTDGWYIDLPQFNCPITYRPASTNPRQASMPDCLDKFVTRRSGKGKLGFALQQTTTMIMADGKSNTSEFQTDLETLELTTGKLDSMLFEIPPGYTEAKSEEALQDNSFDMKAISEQYKNQNNNNNTQPVNPEQKTAGKIRVGVYMPKSDGQVQGADMQAHLVNSLSSAAVEAIAVTTEDDARKFKCDYTLSTEFVKIKQASKVGGLIKAIKNADPNAASSFNIENAVFLKKLADGSVKLQQKIEGKYEGTVENAAKKVLNEESQLVLSAIQ